MLGAVRFVVIGRTSHCTGVKLIKILIIKGVLRAALRGSGAHCHAAIRCLSRLCIANRYYHNLDSRIRPRFTRMQSLYYQEGLLNRISVYAAS